MRFPVNVKTLLSTLVVHSTRVRRFVKKVKGVEAALGDTKVQLLHRLGRKKAGDIGVAANSAPILDMGANWPAAQNGDTDLTQALDSVMAKFEATNTCTELGIVPEELPWVEAPYEPLIVNMATIEVPSFSENPDIVAWLLDHPFRGSAIPNESPQDNLRVGIGFAAPSNNESSAGDPDSPAPANSTSSESTAGDVAVRAPANTECSESTVGDMAIRAPANTECSDSTVGDCEPETSGQGHFLFGDSFGYDPHPEIVPNSTHGHDMSTAEQTGILSVGESPLVRTLIWSFLEAQDAELQHYASADYRIELALSRERQAVMDAIHGLPVATEDWFSIQADIDAEWQAAFAAIDGTPEEMAAWNRINAEVHAAFQQVVAENQAAFGTAENGESMSAEYLEYVQAAQNNGYHEQVSQDDESDAYDDHLQLYDGMQAAYPEDGSPALFAPPGYPYPRWYTRLTADFQGRTAYAAPAEQDSDDDEPYTYASVPQMIPEPQTYGGLLGLYDDTFTGYSPQPTGPVAFWAAMQDGEAFMGTWVNPNRHDSDYASGDDN